MKEVEVIIGEGEKAKTSVVFVDDTNLILGGMKSVFTVIRSSFNDGSKIHHEYWVKCNPYSKSDGVFSRYVEWCGSGFWSFGNLMYVGVGSDFYPSRPNQRPRKLVFDSLRTSVVDDFSSANTHYISGTNTADQSNFWTYVGSSVEGVFGSHADGNFDLYGYLFGWFYERRYRNKGESTTKTAKLCYSSHMVCCDRPLGEDELKNFSPRYEKPGSYISGSEKHEIVWSGKIAEVRDWQIISNNTPITNTYYVAIENKKGELLDVKTTTTFGVTVGSVASEFADRMSESQKNTRVVDDLVIRI